jgi:hypothetical protein
MFGEMLPCPVVNIPNIPIRFCGMEFSEWRTRTVTMPAVLHCPWKSRDGGIAWALANISEDPQTFELPPLADAAYKPTRFVLHINGYPPVTLCREHPVRLNPLDAAILEIVGNDECTNF